MRVFAFVGSILCILAALVPPVRGDDEKTDLGELIEAIQKGSGEAQLDALARLRDLASRGKLGVGALLRLLHGKDEKIREAAPEALAEIGPGVEAIPALLEAMKDDETGGDAARALVAVGRTAIPTLFQASRDANVNVRSNAVYALGAFRPAVQEAVPILTQALSDPEADVRRTAVLAIGGMGANAEKAIPALIAIYKKESVDARVDIADAWGEIGTAARPAIPLLIESLGDQTAPLRLAAARALCRIGGHPKYVVGTLIELVESSGTEERTADRDKPASEAPISAYAAELLGKIGPEAHQGVPTLIKAGKSPNSIVCNCAIEALGEIGPEAKAAIPAIIEHLGDRREAHALPQPHRWAYAGTWEVSITAWTALGKMGPDAAEALIPSLRHRSKDIRVEAILALKGLGPRAAPALNTLVTSLQDSEEEVRRYAASALGALGSAAHPSLPALLKAASDPSSDVREAAADALPLVDSRSPAVVASLMNALEDSDGSVQAHAAMALGKMGAGARPAVVSMAKLLRSERQYYATGHPVISKPLADCVATVLGDLGPVAEAAVPALVEAASKTRNVNWEAIPAIGKIGPAAKAAIPFLLRKSTPEALIAMAQIEPDNAAIAPILRDAWESESRLQPERAIYPDRSWCYVLGRFGPRANAALPKLEELLNLPDRRSRMSVGLTVLEIDPTHQRGLDVCVAALRQRSREFPEVGPVVMGDFLESDVEKRLDGLMVPLGPRARAFVPVLCEILTNPGRSARISAVERLAAIGPEAKEAVPALIQTFGRRDLRFSPGEDLPSKAAESLARIGSAAVPPLISALKDEPYRIRAGAADALGRMGPAATSAIPALTEALRDDRMIVRASAATALKRMGPASASAVSALTGALRDEYSLVRRNAADALGAIGQRARPAASAIVAATRDEYLVVREAAQATLRKIHVQAVPRQ